MAGYIERVIKEAVVLGFAEEEGLEAMKGGFVDHFGGSVEGEYGEENGRKDIVSAYVKRCDNRRQEAAFVERSAEKESRMAVKAEKKGIGRGKRDTEECTEQFLKLNLNDK